MTLILLGKGLVLRGWPSKIEVIGVFSVIREWTGKKSPSSSCGRVALPPWFLGKWPAESFEEKVNTGSFSAKMTPPICAKWGWNIYDWNPSMTRVLNGKQTMWSLNSRVLSVVSITEPLLHRGPTWKNWFQPSLFQSICASVPWFGSKLPVANTSGNDRLLVRCRELEALGFSMEKHEAFRSPAGSESLMVPSPSRPSRTASGSLLESTPRPTELFLGTFLPPRRRRDSPKTSPRVTHLRNRNNSQGGTQKKTYT